MLSAVRWTQVVITGFVINWAADTFVLWEWLLVAAGSPSGYLSSTFESN